MASPSISFSKMHGLGNDFVFVDRRVPENHSALKSFESKNEFLDLVRTVCHREFGVGADGFVIFKEEKGAHLSWDFFNSDGSRAKMCGNASRCAGVFLSKGDVSSREYSFDSDIGKIFVKVIAENRVEVLMPEPSLLKDKVHVSSCGIEAEAKWVDSGVPHLVIMLEKLPAKEVAVEMGRELRYKEEFGPEGTNVTFCQRNGGGLKTFSYERGVEDITKACGTGAIAAAFVAQMLEPKIEGELWTVSMEGGALEVEHQKSAQKTRMIGEAQLEFEGTLSDEE